VIPQDYDMIHEQAARDPASNAARQKLVSSGEQIVMIAPNYKLTPVHPNLVLKTANSSARNKPWNLSKPRRLNAR
jgi:hypothetical protein